MGRIYQGFLKAPLFWTAILFAGGVTLAARFHIDKLYAIAIYGLLALAFSLRLIMAEKKLMRLQGLLFLMLAAGMVALGAYYYQARYASSRADFLPGMDPENPVWLEARAAGLSQYREKYSRVLCRLIWLDRGLGREPEASRFWFNYYDEKKIFPGDRFIALAKIHPLKGFHNPGIPDSSARLRKSGIFFSAGQVSEFPVLKIYSGRKNLFGVLDQYRGLLKEEIERSGARSSYLLLSLILGDESEVPEEVMGDFRASGTAHILVVSGLNLSLVAAFCFTILLAFFRVQPWLLKRMDPYPLAGILSIIPTSFYAVIAGLGIPVVRAWIMVMVLLIAIILRKIRDLLNTLGLAGLIVMIIEPAAIYDPSFQLSFMAVGVLILYFPAVWKVARGNWLAQEAALTRLETKFWRSLPRITLLKLAEYVYGLVLGTTLIQLFTTPITCYFFSRVSLVGPLANLPTIPLCGFWVLPIGLVGLSLSAFSPGLAAWFLNLAGDGAWLMEKSVAFFAGLPHASILVRPPTPLGLAGWFLLLAAGFQAIKVFAQDQGDGQKKFPGRFRRLALSGVLFLLGLALLLGDFHEVKKNRPASDEARVTMLDVGQGQSILVDLPGRKRVLLDGGGKLGSLNLGEAVVARYLLNQGIRELDAVVMSHGQEDHAAGLEYILSQFQVGEFWLSEKPGPLSEQLIEIANHRGIIIRWISREAEPVSIGNAQFEFLSPEQKAIKSLSLNDSSLAIKMTYNGTTILFPGEVGQKIEKQLVSIYHGALSSEILVAGHHGSNSSSSMEFLQAVSPRIILISAGEASGLKLPAPAALARLQKTGATILRTDQQGALALSLQNGTVKILTSPAKGDTFQQ